MIRVTLKKSSVGEWIGYEVSGHAGCAESGSDIICSAVSVLAINTCNSIEAFTSVTPIAEESDGYLFVTFPKETSSEDDAKIKLLMDSLEMGLKNIQASYGSQFLQVKTIQK